MTRDRAKSCFLKGVQLGGRLESNAIQTLADKSAPEVKKDFTCPFPICNGKKESVQA